MSDGMGWEAAANFAGWLTALLPRLVLYPGGLALALAAALAWIAGRRSGPTAAPPAAFPPRDRLALALGWVEAALLPLPGAAPLPLAPDLLGLLGLLLAAGLLTPGGGPAGAGLPLPGGPALCAGAGAVLAAAAGSFALPLAPLPPQVALLATLAYLAGLGSADCGLPDDATRFTFHVSRFMLHASRFTFHVSRFTLHVLWLGWAGLGVALVLGVAASGAGVLAGVALIGAAGLRLGPGRGRWATPVAGIGWLALGGALLAILLPG